MFAASKTASVSGGYQISRSLRFNKDDSAYLNRSAASITNRNIWTWSAWVKRTNLSDFQYNLFGATYDANSYDEFRFNTSDKFRFFIVGGGAVTLDLITTQVFRDTSAWYHIIVAVDTTQATASNRAKIYVNGSQVTAFDTATYPSQNYGPVINFSPQNIGSSPSGFKLNAYMTEINFIDGQALTPSSFGETNAQTGVWQPKAYSGSYGTNGFYLNFSDNSNTTAATLGKDYSGNGNNWTPNNFSVTAGAGNDSLVDSPTSYGTDTGVGGTVRGNYATLNPLKKKSVATISNGNLSLASTGATAYVTGLSTISPSSGYFYMEMTCVGSNTDRPWGIGLVETTAADTATISTASTYFVTNGSGSTVVYLVGATTAATLSTSSTWVAGDVISLAWDSTSTTNKMWVGRNGVWYPSTTGGTVASNSDVAAGNYPTFTISNQANTNPQLFPAFVTYGTAPTVDVNFGQRPFAYTAPSGFKALCTQNLPTPTIGATSTTLANTYFNPVLYTGTGATRTVTGVNFAPDFVWIKSRSAAYNNRLYDKVRGVENVIQSNSTAAEASDGGGLTVFGSDGFTLGSSVSQNESGSTFVSWNWKANGSGSTNTAGTITSTVSANTTSGFSVVTYTTTGSASTVGHGLGATPSMIITKQRNGTTEWYTYSKEIGAGQYLLLNTTGSATSASVIWNNTSPTSTVFSLGSGFGSGETYVAYCFAPIAGYSAFGSYTGNGSADGPFVFTGFRPAYVMIKNTTLASAWIVYDNKRNTANAETNYLLPNSSGAEATLSSLVLDFTSNGFKIRGDQATINTSNNNYIYACFAETPLKFSLAR